MSKELSFRERFAQLASTSANYQRPSYSPVDIRIDRQGEFSKPITLAHLLTANGLRLSEAHKVLNELAEKESVTVTVRPKNLKALLAETTQLGVAAHAVFVIGDWTLQVPHTRLPETPDRGDSRSTVRLGDEYREATVGSLRQVYGESFAKDFVPSAKLADILVGLDAVSLEALAAKPPS